MKTIFLLIISLLGFAVNNFTQSIKIIPKKTVYIRKNQEGFENKRKVTVNYPRIENFDKNISAKIQEQISYWKNFEISLKEVKTEFGINELSYKINYNKNYILDITLTQESIGAYPWTEKRFIVIDLQTGKRIKPDELFAAKSIGTITKMIQAAMKRELKESELEPENAFFNKPAFKINTLKLADLEGFTVSDKGITFLFDYEFNFASLANEPAGRYFFSWKQLKPFLKKDGLFRRFAR